MILEASCVRMPSSLSCSILRSNSRSSAKSEAYVLLDIAPDYDYVDTARRVDTAEELCRLMLEDTALDVLLLTENEHSMETADPLERAEILRRWQPYFEQLPEYEYLRKELTSEWP